jgi:REP element-mobilizing transposase RayT
MANTYGEAYFHVVFSTRFRKKQLEPRWQGALNGYMVEMLRRRSLFPLQVNGHLDHIHLLFGYHPSVRLDDVVREIKVATNKWINANYSLSERFRWQEGYAYFTCKKKDLPGLIQYIVNQQRHHEKMSYEREVVLLMKRYEVKYDPDRLFG